MPVNKYDLQFFLTSALPEVEQTITSQSIGGHPATVGSSLTRSLVFPWEYLSSDVGLYDTSFNLSSYTDIENEERIAINGELMAVNSISSTSVTVQERALNNKRRFHTVGDIVQGLNRKLFNNNLNDEFKQYRCVALKNLNSSHTAYDVSLYISQGSRNSGCRYRIAVEMPLFDKSSAPIASGTVNSFTSPALSIYNDDDLNNSVVYFITSDANNGEYRVISDFDQATFTATLDSDLPTAIVAGSDYELRPAPAQRVSSGIIKPQVGLGRVSNFIDATASSAIDIDVTGNREHGSDLQPGDVVYVWIERSLFKTAEAMNDNSFSIGINYETS